LNRTPIAHEIRARINKWDYIKLKRFYTANRVEDPDINPHSYAHLVFNKGVKNM
jgi:hypothetical protein